LGDHPVNNSLCPTFYFVEGRALIYEPYFFFPPPFLFKIDLSPIDQYCKIDPEIDQDSINHKLELTRTSKKELHQLHITKIALFLIKSNSFRFFLSKIKPKISPW